jgi:hypothetical protein
MATRPSGLASGQSQITCPTCNGSGKVFNSQSGQTTTCPTCGGTGKVNVTLADLPFWYPAPVTLTSGQQNLNATITIDNDADFEWRWIIASSILSNGSAGLFSVTLIDRFTSRPLMSPGIPINGENIAGSAQLPFILPKPYLLRRTSSILLQFNERSVPGGGVTNSVQFNLVGYKIS